MPWPELLAIELVRQLQSAGQIQTAEQAPKTTPAELASIIQYCRLLLLQFSTAQLGASTVDSSSSSGTSKAKTVQWTARSRPPHPTPHPAPHPSTILSLFDIHMKGPSTPPLPGAALKGLYGNGYSGCPFLHRLFQRGQVVARLSYAVLASHTT